MTRKRRKSASNGPRPLLADCRDCPFPALRVQRLCCVCATILRREDGALVVSERPLPEYLEGSR
jgi:hypothetical protein